MKRLILLLDADDTILDFNRAETIAISKVLESYELMSYKDIVKNYKIINSQVWSEYEKNLITREELAYIRFDRLFKMYDIKGIDSKKICEDYRIALANTPTTIYGVKKFLNSIYKIHDLYIITNGIVHTQKTRFKLANLDKYFIDVFISEAINMRKPDKEFFDYVKNNIANYNNDIAYIIGDSLTSDILGGINSHIKTIWFNKKNRKKNLDIVPDYEVKSYDELNILLDKLSKD